MRDVDILQALLEHRVLTIHHMRALFFRSGPVARRRMVKLYRLGVVDRFQLPGRRSTPNHYVLDVLGARIVAAHRGLSMRDLGWHKEDTEALPFRSEFRHLIAVNEFFVRLSGTARKFNCELNEWWGELRCRRTWDAIALPDGYGRLERGDRSRSFMLEYDLGTESPGRLAKKLTDYEDLARLADRPDVLLFLFQDPEREASARQRLHNPGLTLATTTRAEFEDDPLGPIWLAIGSETRCSLLDLPIRAPASGEATG